MNELIYNLEQINNKLRFKTPEDIISWGLLQAESPILTTNFGPYSASLLHAVSKIKKDIKVIWVDTGYNTPNTYKYAETIINRLQLNIKQYIPKQTAAYRDVILGVPDVDNPKHKLFTEQVKLEPFKRAMKEHNPDVWFTNIRKGQTAFRDSLDIVSVTKNGVIKVSPFYYWTDKKIDTYLVEHNLLNELKYYDPTKQLANRECGLHV